MAATREACDDVGVPTGAFGRRRPEGDAMSLSITCARLLLSVAPLLPATAGVAAATASPLPLATFSSAATLSGPVANAAFAPGRDATPAPAFAGVISLRQTVLATLPAITDPVVAGRDARLFPGITLAFTTVGTTLAPLAAGEMVRETAPGPVPSYWRVIPQYGRVWHDPADGDWSRAALPLMLVNDTENHAHQGLATFLYRRGEVTGVRLQFVQQTGPYVLKPQFVAFGFAPATVAPLPAAELAGAEPRIRAELAGRLPARPWSELVADSAPGTLAGFGGPLYPKWRVASALVRDGTLYFQAEETPYGPYPYPLEMRFGVRSVTKSVWAPLALLRLAEVYGPWVMTLHVGDYVHGLDPKWNRVRFIDAASMASGFGGVGSTKTQPNDLFDGYLEGHYDDWYLAPSAAAKLEMINAHLHPYPWEPGTVVRYRDQDMWLLGLAVDAFVKSVRGPAADVRQLVEDEVLRPIGVPHAPSVRTREPDGRDGVVWFNAGYYPTLDDLAKIALLYQHEGAAGGHQLLNRALTADLLAARGALPKAHDSSLGLATPDAGEELYRLGFHYTPYTAANGRRYYLPGMHGSGENEVMLYPNGLVSIRMAKASNLPPGEQALSDAGPETIRAVERLAPF
jgi:hypothetical protein